MKSAPASSLALLALLAMAGPLLGQQRSTAVLAGYGSALYEATADDEYVNNFSASVSPVILYTMGTDFLFETELEFSVEGEATQTTLEYAQLDYLGFDNVQIIAGKFLLPFGVFGERLHPSWINKLPTMPVLFGHAHGGVAEGSLLPIMADAGLMVRIAKPFGGDWALNFSGYVTQGPTLADAAAEGDDHAHQDLRQASVVGDGAPGAGGDALAPPVAFGVAFGDNNKNKMLGGRLGLVKGGSFEIYASGFQAMYDPGNFLDFKGGALSVEYRRGGFELRGEGVLLQQEFEHDGGYETLDRSGFYLQASRRAGSWEPVVRWGYLSDPTVDGTAVEEGHQEVALGLDYWLASSLPVKLAWEFHEGRPDQFAIQWAFGF